MLGDNSLRNIELESPGKPKWAKPRPSSYACLSVQGQPISGGRVEKATAILHTQPRNGIEHAASLTRTPECAWGTGTP